MLIEEQNKQSMDSITMHPMDWDIRNLYDSGWHFNLVGQIVLFNIAKDD